MPSYEVNALHSIDGRIGIGNNNAKRQDMILRISGRTSLTEYTHMKRVSEIEDFSKSSVIAQSV
jgi:hypothetical protein